MSLGKLPPDWAWDLAVNESTRTQIGRKPPAIGAEKSHVLGLESKILVTWDDDKSSRGTNLKMIYKKSFPRVGDLLEVGELLGVSYMINDNQEIFLPREKGCSEKDFVKKLEELIEVSDSLREINGEIRVVRDGIEKRIISLGVEKEVGFLREKRPPLEISMVTRGRPKGGQNKRVRNAVSENDSFGKTQWRAKMKGMFKEIFPKGKESITKGQSQVLCFPGAGGKEADLWLGQGFTQEDLLLVEKDINLADSLQKKYDRATVTKAKFGDQGGKQILKKLTTASFNAAQKIAEKEGIDFRYGRTKYAVLSFDPEGALTRKFFDDMYRLILESGKKCLFSANFNLKRESEEQLKFYRELAGENPGENEDLHQLRLKATANLPRLFERDGNRLSGRKIAFGKIRSGHYEGDSEATRMYWVMAEISTLGMEETEKQRAEHVLRNY